MRDDRLHKEIFFYKTTEETFSNTTENGLYLQARAGDITTQNLEGKEEIVLKNQQEPITEVMNRSSV